MFKWIEEYQEANPQIKYFIINWIIYGLAIIVTAVYCYARLDFVRSNKAPPSSTVEKSIQAK